MTLEQYLRWTAEYRKLFLRPGDDASFMDPWAERLIDFAFADLSRALLDMQADPRLLTKEGGWARNHLPLLLEHARRIRGDRERAERREKLVDFAEKPAPCEAWKRGMQRWGVGR